MWPCIFTSHSISLGFYLLSGFSGYSLLVKFCSTVGWWSKKISLTLAAQHQDQNVCQILVHTSVWSFHKAQNLSLTVFHSMKPTESFLLSNLKLDFPRNQLEYQKSLIHFVSLLSAECCWVVLSSLFWGLQYCRAWLYSVKQTLSLLCLEVSACLSEKLWQFYELNSDI